MLVAIVDFVFLIANSCECNLKCKGQFLCDHVSIIDNSRDVLRHGG